MTHYIPEDLDCKIGDLMQNNKLTGPAFVGQGCSKFVGSDCYGLFIVRLEKTKTGKPLVGLVNADSKFETCWEDGNMTCALPHGETDPKKCEPDFWITTYGTWKRSKRSKWYKCDSTGKRFPGRWNAVSFGWNGAFGYQDSSF